MRVIHSRTVNCFLCVILLSFLSTGCMFKRLQENLDEFEQFVTISGVVEIADPISHPIFVALLTEDPINPVLVNYNVMTRPGKFRFTTPPGIYRVFAFEDINRDQKYQQEEKIGNSELLVLNQPGASIEDVTVVVSDAHTKEIIDEFKRIKGRATVDLPNYRLNTGAITRLDNEYFSHQYASMGMWEPMRFIHEVPFGLFFMEEYDPNKVPVLFVHGITGSPADFQYLIDNLDSEYFQAWLAYYPSGMPLDLVAESFSTIIEEARVKYGFRELMVVAHSMGGLVSRAFINQQLREHENSYVRSLVTISTPWGGHKAAESGVQYAPAVVPVWKDMMPNSEFLRTLFSVQFPSDLPYYLLFSFQGGRSISAENNDGVVSLASQLRPEAQESAVLERGFDEGHTSILSNESVSTLLNKLLSNVYK